MVGAFSPLTFKINIGMYVLIAILLIALVLFLLLFFLPLFSCSLLLWFDDSLNVVFVMIFLICVCINCKFAVCSYPEVLI